MTLILHVTGPVHKPGKLLNFFIYEAGKQPGRPYKPRPNTADRWLEMIERAIAKGADRLLITWGRIPGLKLPFPPIGRWSRKYDRCRKCRTTRKPHAQEGFCRGCIGSINYHRHRDRIAATRKRRRLENDTYEKDRPRVKAWVEANRERNSAVKKAWYHRTKTEKWPIGLDVWAPYCGFMCHGQVAGRPDGKSILVRLDGGTEILFGVRRLKELSRAKPLSAEATHRKTDRELQALLLGREAA